MTCQTGHSKNSQLIVITTFGYFYFLLYLHVQLSKNARSTCPAGLICIIPAMFPGKFFIVYRSSFFLSLFTVAGATFI